MRWTAIWTIEIVSSSIDSDESNPIIIGGRSRKWFPVKEAIKILISRQKYDKSSYFKLAGCHVESSS